jgi:hypothetical protein
MNSELDLRIAFRCLLIMVVYNGLQLQEGGALEALYF